MMDAHSSQFSLLAPPLILLAAAVISVPLARFARLSAIVAYLVAGIVIGPYGLRLFSTPESVLPVAELGVVMLLFLIGLELELSRLLAMRRDIFGLGVAQLVITAAAIAGLAIATGLFQWRAALLAGLALAMSATSIALRILEERGHLQQPYGQRAFAILLFQDMAIVPLLALVPLLAPSAGATPAVEPRRRREQRRTDRGRHRRRGGRRPLPAQSVLPSACRDGRPRSDDRGRAADRARIGAADADRRHVDGARRVSRRRAARGIDLPPRARGRHRTVPRPSAGAVLHGRRHVDRHAHRVGEPLVHPRRGAPDHAAQGRHRVGAVPRHLRETRRGLAGRLGADRCRRIRLRAASGRHRAGRSQRQPGQPPFRDRRDHAAARPALRDPHRSRGAPSCARRRARSRRLQRGARLGAGDRLRALRADRVAVSARRGDRRDRDRFRPDHDSGRRRGSASRSTTATARGSTCCARPVSRRRG